MIGSFQFRRVSERWGSARLPHARLRRDCSVGDAADGGEGGAVVAGGADEPLQAGAQYRLGIQLAEIADLDDAVLQAGELAVGERDHVDRRGAGDSARTDFVE